MDRRWSLQSRLRYGTYRHNAESTTTWCDLDALTDEVLARCDVLGRRLQREPGRLTRTFLGRRQRRFTSCSATGCEAPGLDVRVDAVGNLIGRRAGANANARVFVVGSHLDTVPDAGKYDGILGVLLGIAAVEALAGRRFRCALEVIAFSRGGGRPLSHAVPRQPGRLRPLRRRTAGTRSMPTAISMARALRDFGLDPAAIAAAAYPAGQLAGYLEAHIEQGPVLEALNLPLGVVEAIVGQSRFWLHFDGKAGHAGTQPMELRRDALAAAAEFVVAVEQTRRATRRAAGDGRQR